MLAKKLKESVRSGSLKNRSQQFEVYKKINEIGKSLIIEPDVEKILILAIDKMIELSGAERGLIILFDKNGGILFETVRYMDKMDPENSPFGINRSIIDKVWKTGSDIFLSNALIDVPFSKSRSITKLRILSVICLPVKVGERIFGVVYVENRSLSGTFNEKDYRFMKELSDFISLVAFNACEKNRLRGKIDNLENELRCKYSFDIIIGHHPRMIEILKLVSQVSNSEATVLIQGESGTGKELIARSIHYNSDRRDKPFVPINCGAIPENLQESELFGHVRGAFTGASVNKTGWFEEADQGTIFLDEVAEMSPALQVKLLRVLQSGEYSPVGSSQHRFCDVRIVAATIKNLKVLVSENRFREDLYYRLNIIDICLPPLRERKSDIPILIQHYLKKFGEQYRRKDLSLSQKTEGLLLNYDYPGNVRELENIILHAIALVEGEIIERKHLPRHFRFEERQELSGPKLTTFKKAKQKVLEDFESNYINECLKISKGNISEAAKNAGMQYPNFYTKVKKYDINSLAYKLKEE